MHFRRPRPDAVDAVTGERYDDVIVLWVPDEGDKRALVDDERSAAVEDAWCSRVSQRRGAAWPAAGPPP